MPLLPYVMIRPAELCRDAENDRAPALTSSEGGDPKFLAISSFTSLPRVSAQARCTRRACFGASSTSFPGTRALRDLPIPSSGFDAVRSLAALIGACRRTRPRLDDMIECASIAAYDFPVLLGPMNTVRGRRETLPF